MKQEQERINRWRQNHHKSLEILAQEVGCNKSGLALWRGLARIERNTTSAIAAYCNGAMSQEQLDKACDRAKRSIAKLFGGKLPNGVYINRDPRGYALKLDPEVRPLPEGITKDWGSYGLLAAVIE